MTASEHRGRRRLASPPTALVLGGLVIALLAASILTASVNHIFALHDIPAVVLITTTTAVGVVVARRQPRNPVGWIRTSPAAPRRPRSNCSAASSSARRWC